MNRLHGIFAIEISSYHICVVLIQYSASYHHKTMRSFLSSCLIVSSILTTVVVIKALNPTR